MKREKTYFNKGDDCDTGEHRYITVTEETVECCERKDSGLKCEYQERDIRTCPVCRNEVDRRDMNFTKDCHGIPFRLVCYRCYERLMEKGYDGERYTDADEQIEDDY